MFIPRKIAKEVRVGDIILIQGKTPQTVEKIESDIIDGCLTFRWGYGGICVPATATVLLQN